MHHFIETFWKELQLKYKTTCLYITSNRPSHSNQSFQDVGTNSHFITLADFYFSIDLL